MNFCRSAVAKVTTTLVDLRAVTCVTQDPREGNRGNTSNAGAQYARVVTFHPAMKRASAEASRLCGLLTRASGRDPPRMLVLLKARNESPDYAPRATARHFSAIAGWSSGIEVVPVPLRLIRLRGRRGNRCRLSILRRGRAWQGEASRGHLSFLP